MKKSNIQDLAIIFIVSLLGRVIPFLFYLLNPKYIFNNSITPYFYKFDSWFYAGVLNQYPKFLVFIIPCLISIMSLFFIYSVLTKLKVSRNIKILSVLLISLHPNFFAQSLIGYVDTNAIIFLTTSIMLWAFISYFIEDKHKLFYILTICFFSILLYLSWDGSYYIDSIFLLGFYSIFFFNDIINKKRFLLHIFIILYIGLSTFGYLLFRLKDIYDLKGLGVAEYMPHLFVGSWLCILMIFVISLLNLNKIFNLENKRSKVYLFLLVASIYSFFPAALIQRFSSISMIFVITYLALLLNDLFFKESKKTITLVLGLLLILFYVACILSVEYYKPIVNDDLYNNLERLKYDNNSIINTWEYGHLINYADGMQRDILERAKPTERSNNISLNLNMDIDQAVSYFDTINRTEKYYIIFNNQQQITNQDSIISRSVNNQDLKYYELVSKSRVFDKTFYILRRV